ncbi:MAG: GNAT family N-acetyltransferase [Chloroflexota bacterium]
MTTVREATAADVDAVVALFLRCWRESYAEVLPPTAIEVFDEAGAVELWRRALVTPRPGTRGVVAVEGDRVVGIARMGRDPDEPDAGHVFSLYVDPRAQGGGVGRRLLDEAVAWLGSAGVTTATLWVFEANRRARSFYALGGWLPDGGTRVEPEFGEPEVRLRRTL